MPSSRIRWFLILALAALRSTLAHAQSAAPAEPTDVLDDDGGTPAPTPPPDLPPPPTSPPSDSPSPAPTPQPVPDETPPPAAPAANNAKPDKSDHEAHGVFGMDIGIGGLLSDNGIYHPGAGRGFFLGFRLHRFTLEWHFAESYQARVDADYAGANAAHSLDIGIYAVRMQVAPAISLMAGVVRAGIPVLTATQNQFSHLWLIESATSEGIGPIAGIGVAKVYDWGLSIAAEARVGKIVANDADPPYLTPTGPADGNGVIPVMLQTAELRPLVGMLLVSFRISPP